MNPEETTENNETPAAGAEQTDWSKPEEEKKTDDMPAEDGAETAAPADDSAAA